jgi:CheY-like chemotaxis protein
VKAAERAAALTQQLLAFSRKQVNAPKVVSLTAIVKGTEKMFRRLIAEDIELVTWSEPDLWPVLADPSQIEQILVNLVVNARDAMPGGGRLSIEMRNVELDTGGIATHPGLQPGNYVELAVADTGSGMDAETVARIFEPFFTTKEAGKGTGLGLATVYGIVQQSGGATEVQSQVGRGTTFHVYLPKTSGEVAAPPQKTLAATRGSETVLLVEDDDHVRALVASMLKKHGYTVLVASQGDQALQIAGRHTGPIHLLLTDVVMPGMSGRALSEKLTAARPNTRVLYMSGYSDDAVLGHGVRSAGTHFIQKPFAIETLAQKVRQTLSAPANA